jgi:hypothetical protein
MERKRNRWTWTRNLLRFCIRQALSRIGFPCRLATVSCLLATVSQAQISFEKTYGGTSDDRGRSVQQTVPDGGYIITGWTWSFGAGDRDVYLIKTDSLGDTLWTRTYGGTSDDRGSSVRQTIPDGGYIIVGETHSFDIRFGDLYLIKTDPSGNTLWTKTYGGINPDAGRSIQQTVPDGGYIIAGWTASFGAGNTDVYLIKTDSLGDTLWTRTYGDTAWDVGVSVQQTTDGGYIITGSTMSFGADLIDFYVIKTDSLGDTLWTRIYGGIASDEGHSVQETQDGGYIITGTTGSFGPGVPNVYLLKMDFWGDTLWTRTHGGLYLDYGYSVQQTVPDGGYIIAGDKWSLVADSADVCLIKTDSLGDTLWTKTYGSFAVDVGRYVQQTQDGGYIIVGYTRSFGAGEFDVYLIKTLFWCR